MRNRDRWIKIVAVALAFMMLVPVIALLVGSAVSEGSLDVLSSAAHLTLS